jgi:hypothetical protein
MQGEPTWVSGLPHLYEEKRSQGKVWTNHRIVHVSSKCGYAVEQNTDERCNIPVATSRYRELASWYREMPSCTAYALIEGLDWSCASLTVWLLPACTHDPQWLCVLLVLLIMFL